MEFKEYKHNDRVYKLQLMDNDEVVSTIGLNGGFGDELCLYWVTGENYQNKGYGKKTLNEFIKISKDANIKSLMVNIASSNIASISLAKSCGFEESDFNGFKRYRLIL